MIKQNVTLKIKVYASSRILFIICAMSYKINNKIFIEQSGEDLYEILNTNIYGAKLPPESNEIAGHVDKYKQNSENILMQQCYKVNFNRKKCEIICIPYFL